MLCAGNWNCCVKTQAADNDLNLSNTLIDDELVDPHDDLGVKDSHGSMNLLHSQFDKLLIGPNVSHHEGQGAGEEKLGEADTVSSFGDESSASSEDVQPSARMNKYEKVESDKEDKELKAASPKRQTKARSSKKGFSSGSMDDEVEVGDEPLPFHHKADDVKERLITALKQNEKLQVVCSNFDEKQLVETVMAMYPKKVKLDEDVIKQGDSGDAFYIVDRGKFDFLVQKSMDTEQVKVGGCGAGTVFGELALMYDAPRAATVRCTSKTGSLWALGRKAFRQQMVRASTLKTRQYDSWLAEMELFKVLTPQQLSVLSTMLKPETFQKDSCIIKEGDTGDRFFILTAGEARAYITGKDGPKEVMKYNKQGQYFGEIALLGNVKRKATIRCISNVSIVYVLKRDFDEIIGPAKAVLMKGIEDYEKVI